MQIAKRTKENNIAEHILYMFQIEDLIRANQFDVETIYHNILKPQINDEATASAYKDWYKGLIKQMKFESVTKQGHISEINEIIMELLLLHNTLLNIIKEPKYLKAFEDALPSLKDFQQKSNSGDINIIEVGFNALYSKIILKLKKAPISDATENAFISISRMYAYLAAYYKKMKNGDLNFANN